MGVERASSPSFGLHRAIVSHVDVLIATGDPVDGSTTRGPGRSTALASAEL